MDISTFFTLPVLMGVVFAGSVLLLFIGIDHALSSKNATIETRLDRYTARQADASGIKSREPGERFSGLVNEKRGNAIATDLARADLHLTPGEYVAINAGTVLLGAVALYFLAGNF